MLRAYAPTSAAVGFWNLGFLEPSGTGGEAGGSEEEDSESESESESDTEGHFRFAVPTLLAGVLAELLSSS